MLHVQEAIPHSSSLMFGGPVVAPPLPQATTSTRSARVIEQLQENFEDIQREIATTRLQIEAARKAKFQYESEVESYRESNDQCRQVVKDLMKVLESKHHNLDRTKRSSFGLETQVKKLKDEALVSRKQLDDLRRRELVLERDRDLAVSVKECTERQYIVLKQSISHLQERFDNETSGLQYELATIQEKTVLVMDKGLQLERMVHIQLGKRAEAKKALLWRLTQLKEQDQSSARHFVASMGSNLTLFYDTIRNLETSTNNMACAVTRCRDDVHGLVAKIKAYNA